MRNIEQIIDSMIEGVHLEDAVDGLIFEGWKQALRASRGKYALAGATIGGTAGAAYGARKAKKGEKLKGALKGAGKGSVIGALGGVAAHGARRFYRGQQMGGTKIERELRNTGRAVRRAEKEAAAVKDINKEVEELVRNNAEVRDLRAKRDDLQAERDYLSRLKKSKTEFKDKGARDIASQQQDAKMLRGQLRSQFKKGKGKPKK